MIVTINSKHENWLNFIFYSLPFYYFRFKSAKLYCLYFNLVFNWNTEEEKVLLTVHVKAIIILNIVELNIVLQIKQRGFLQDVPYLKINHKDTYRSALFCSSFYKIIMMRIMNVWIFFFYKLVIRGSIRFYWTKIYTFPSDRQFLSWELKFRFSSRFLFSKSEHEAIVQSLKGVYISVLGNYNSYTPALHFPK